MSNTMNTILLLYNYLIFIQLIVFFQLSFFCTDFLPNFHRTTKLVLQRDKAIDDLLFTCFLPRGPLSFCWHLHWLQSRPVADVLSGESDCYHQFKTFTHSMYVDYWTICYKLEVQQNKKKSPLLHVIEGRVLDSKAPKQIDKIWQVLVSAVEKVTQVIQKFVTWQHQKWG